MLAVFRHATTRRTLAARAGSIYAPILRARHHTTLSAFGSAAEDGGASKAEPASAALIAVANSCGVRYPKLLCGRSSLYSIFPRRDLAPRIEQVLKPTHVQAFFPQP